MFSLTARLSINSQFLCMNLPIDRITTKSLIMNLIGFFLGAYYLDIVILLRFNENIWKQPYHYNNKIHSRENKGAHIILPCLARGYQKTKKKTPSFSNTKGQLLQF